MFEITLENMCETLGYMSKYKVAPINMLRDLWAFRYSPTVVESRLRRAEDGQKEKIMPWMVHSYIFTRHEIFILVFIISNRYGVQNQFWQNQLNIA